MHRENGEFRRQARIALADKLNQRKGRRRQIGDHAVAMTLGGVVAGVRSLLGHFFAKRESRLPRGGGGDDVSDGGQERHSSVLDR